MAVALPAAKPHPNGVPRVGDVYWVDTAGCYGGNKKPTRPVVVVRAAKPPLLTDVLIVARTSDCNPRATHVKHPQDPALGLRKPGAFVKTYRRSIDVRFFSMPKLTSYQGVLDDRYLEDVLKMVGL